MEAPLPGGDIGPGHFADVYEGGAVRRALEADRLMFDLAAAQHGVVTRRQLLAAGVGADAVERRARAGLLRRLHRGVYCVGPVTAPHAREMAAALACGGQVVISQRTAAALWQISAQQAATEPVDILCPHSHHGRRNGIRARRVRTLRADEVTRIEGIPVTTAERTIMDLASVIGGRELERAVAEAYARRLTTRDAIIRLLGRHAGEPGVRELTALFASSRPALTRSQAEERFLDLVRSAGLPEPELNVMVCGFRVDFYWRRQRFVVEVDGFAFHGTPDRFESDRKRDAVLAAAGIRVMRVTWRQMEEQPAAVLVRLAQALALAGWSEPDTPMEPR